MSPLAVIAAVVAPAAFWIGYYYYKDRFKPEPFLNLAASFVMGFASGWLCFWFYAVLTRAGLVADYGAILRHSTPLQFFSYNVVFVGIIEEVFKFLPFVLVVLRFRAFDETLDGIVYAAAVAVGFASFENLRYLPHLSGAVFLGRAVASPLTHTVFASIWGYAVGKAFLARRSVLAACIIGIGVAGTAHGLYDFLAYSHALRIFSALLILGIWAWVIGMLERKRKPLI